jgi:hypothetical protein
MIKILNWAADLNNAKITKPKGSPNHYKDLFLLQSEKLFRPPV